MKVCKWHHKYLNITGIYVNIQLIGILYEVQLSLIKTTAEAGNNEDPNYEPYLLFIFLVFIFCTV